MNKNELTAYFDSSAKTRDRWKKKNWYYHQVLTDWVKFLIPEKQAVLEIGSSTGDLLAALGPSRGLGLDISHAMVRQAQHKYPKMEWRQDDAENLKTQEIFDYIVLSDLVGYVHDVERVFLNLQKISHPKTKVVITHYNHLWEPAMQFAEHLGFKARQPLENWLSDKDVENLLYLAGFEIIKQGNKLIFPIYIPFVSSFLNRFLGNLPGIRKLGVIQYYIARQIPKQTMDYSVSVVIPCRNEQGNIEQAVSRMPKIGKWDEIIFIEDHSTDDTYAEIKRISKKYESTHKVRYATQADTGERGKRDAVRRGFAMAEGEALMILDADLTVPPEDLPKFYRAIATGKGEFINGSRLVYPMEKEAMRFFNVLGNKFFSVMLTWLLGQRIKDTLCGTKVFLKKDYEKIEAGRSYFGDFDSFGDFDQLFGAAKLNLKIVELPVRYLARTYGETKMRRWKHGWHLLRMVVFAMRRIKFI